MSSLVRSCMELRNIFLRGWGTLKTAAVYHARLRTAHFVVQRIACGTFLYRGCNQTKGNPKTVGFWAFLHPFAAEGKRMSRRSAKYSRRRQTCRTRVQPAIEEQKTGRRDASPCVVRDRSREKRPAPGARNTSFPSYHKSTKDCNARSAFPAAGHCI